MGDSLREVAKSARAVHATTGLEERSVEIVEFIADHPEGVRAANVTDEFEDIDSIRQACTCDACRGWSDSQDQARSVRSYKAFEVLVDRKRTQHAKQNKQSVLGAPNMR